MMNSKRNQTIAIARFLMYKHSLTGCGQLCEGFDAVLPGKCGGSGHGASGRAFEAAGDGLSLCDCVYAL